jgi:hypothetical protein
MSKNAQRKPHAPRKRPKYRENAQNPEKMPQIPGIMPEFSICLLCRKHCRHIPLGPKRRYQDLMNSAGDAALSSAEALRQRGRAEAAEARAAAAEEKLRIARWKLSMNVFYRAGLEGVTKERDSVLEAGAHTRPLFSFVEMQTSTFRLDVSTFRGLSSEGASAETSQVELRSGRLLWLR